MRYSAICAALLATAGTSFSVSAADAAPKPWRLHEALDLPDWFDLGGEQRTRYETLGNQFRAGRTGGDQALTMRTSLVGQFKTDPAGLLVEMMDSRQYLSDSGTPIDNTMVNPFEVLQAYVRWNAHDLIPGGTNTVKIGRETLDLGNRRLMARNAYRNTINSFTGIDWLWSADKGGSIRAFYFLPVRRLPEDSTSLLDNQIVSDTQGFGQQFWGVYATSPKLAHDIRAELYWFQLYESAAVTSRERRLHTPGFRIFRNPTPGHWDLEIEAALQRGTSRASAGAQPALDHTAYLVHGGVGYTFSTVWTPRIGIRYDQASGDGNPTDGENNRFDTLFGARRWEFGPTSIYGAIARSNIRSPDYMVSVKPTKTTEVSVAHRFIWLDSARDAYTAANVRDASGNSGTFVGQQIETRFRWEAIPGNLRFDTGFVWLADGEFLKTAPNATKQGDTTFAYFEATLTF